MKDKIVNSIKEQLFKLTKKKFSKEYILEYIIPIIDYIVRSKRKKFLIAGCQGIGKTTLLKIIEKNVRLFYNKNILTLSLDDYYLSKDQRIKLANKIHPLLMTRGVPGTHDIDKLIRNIKAFEKNQYPIEKPIFNKINDDRSKKINYVNLKADILVLEGWCCGSPPIEKKFLYKNINLLEKNKDPKKIWRNYYNKKLRNEYAKLFSLFDKKIFLKTPSFSFVLNWRLKQERMMSGNNKNNIMNRKSVECFISHYEKITLWMLKILSIKSDIVIKINKNQKISKIIIN